MNGRRQMGNRWNAKTQNLPRPKVCKSDPPNSGRSCDVQPIVVTMEEGGIDDFEAKARNESLDPQDNVDISVGGEGDFELEPQVIPNDGVFGGVNIEDQGNPPATYNIVILFVWSDGATCQKNMTAHVIPE